MQPIARVVILMSTKPSILHKVFTVSAIMVITKPSQEFVSPATILANNAKHHHITVFNVIIVPLEL